MHLFPFINITTGAYSAPVCCLLTFSVVRFLLRTLRCLFRRSYEYRSGLTDMYSIAGFVHTVPVHATVMMFDFTGFICRTYHYCRQWIQHIPLVSRSALPCLFPHFFYCCNSLTRVGISCFFLDTTPFKIIFFAVFLQIKCINDILFRFLRRKDNSSVDSSRISVSIKEYHLYSIFLQYFRQIWSQHLFHFLQFFFTHRIQLSHAKYHIIYCKLLEILETDILCRLSCKTASCLEHCLCLFFQIDSCNLFQVSLQLFHPAMCRSASGITVYRK